MNLNENIQTEEEFLKTYDSSKFEKPSVTNDILIFSTENIKEVNLRKVPKKGLQILLIQRNEHPDMYKWAIPGGFVHMDESLKDGADRELKEETGIDNLYVEQLYTFGDVNRDKRTRVISVGNIALVSKETMNPVAGDDAKSLQWFWINKKFISKEDLKKEVIKNHILELISEDGSIVILYKIKEVISKTALRNMATEYTFSEKSTDKLAFDHYKIMDYAIDRLRSKVEYTPIAIHLLKRLFTVKELQYAYEAILGRDVLNFRRKIGSMIIATEEKIEGKPYRPAQVFKFNEEWEHEF